MIISHSRRFIFLKTKKTAGTSLEIALSKYCQDVDVLAPLVDYDEKTRRQVSGRGAQNFTKSLSESSLSEKVRRLAFRRPIAKYTEHMAAVDIRRVVGDATWNSYFKFTVVRNPFDRIISRYFWSLNNRHRYPDRWKAHEFEQFLRYFPECINENWKIYTEGDAILADDVVRYENFEEDLARVSRSIGLEHNIYDDLRQITTKAGIRPKTVNLAAMIGPAEQATIQYLCSREIETFGYDFAAVAGMLT